jgi:hypothetical protein
LGIPKNKSQESGIFSTLKKHHARNHNFTTKTPQLHHKKTINIHPLFPTPLQKTPQKAQNPTLHHPKNFFSKKQKNAAPTQ